MKSAIPSAADVAKRMESMDTAALQRLADLSAVPFHTLRKIKSRETENPGIETVRKFAPFIERAMKAPQVQA